MRNHFSLGFAASVLLLSGIAQANSTGLTVTAEGTSVHVRPEAASAVVMKAKKGQRFATDGRTQGGYYKIVTKSGRGMWLAESDVRLDSENPAEDAVAPSARSSVAGGAGEPSFKRLTFDIGGSSNFSNGESAYEGHLGVNLHILSWLTWRNAPFYRSQSGMDAQYGLDSSLQGHYGFKLVEGFEPNVMLGGGYRVLNVSAGDAPFVEGGAGLRVGGLGVDASVKQIFHAVTTAGYPNERLYTLNISGGVSF